MTRDRLQRLQNLSPEKRSLLLKALQQEAASSKPSKILPQRDRSFPIPLSFAQQRLWFLEQLQPESSAAYNISTAAILKGRLDVALLQKSLNEIIRRHEILRTTFTTVEDRPVQEIAPTLTLEIPVVDLQQLSQAQKETEIQRLAIASKSGTRSVIARAQQFQLNRLPLLQVTVLRLEETEHAIILTMHHIISDGWSLGVLLEELMALYQGFALPELPIQYADFALWQRQWLQGVLETQLNYWRKQLSGTLPILQLPSDRPRPQVPSFRGATQSFSLSSELSRSLNALSRQEGTTLFMTLLAAFKVLLYRYTEQEDIIVGSPIANRNRAEIEGLIGLFVNTLVLRTNLDGNPSFRELLGRVREVTLGAYARQDVPFELLVEELQPQRDLSHHPLFQVMFAFQNAPSRNLEIADLTYSPLNIPKETAQFDLSLVVAEGTQGIYGSLEYSTDLFDAEAINRMLENFKTLLSSIVATPERRISELPILAEAEQHLLLVEFNKKGRGQKAEDSRREAEIKSRGERPYSFQEGFANAPTIHALFEERAAQNPNAIAVTFANKSLTYWQLNAKANQLARYLRSLGVKPDVPVGICLEKGLEMANAILAVLKAGGAYVPLDPAYPSERLNLILADVKPLLVLTKERLQAIELDGESEANLDINVSEKNLAYIIHTSGSTGTPKGVLITHQTLVNNSIAAAKAYQLQSCDRVLQFASLSFDVAAEEFFASWLIGATVVIKPETLILFSDFLQFIEREKISVLNLPTAYWHEWVSDLDRTKTLLPFTLRLVIVGTEQARSDRLALWQQLVGEIASGTLRLKDGLRQRERIDWINAYGTTETTIGATIYRASSNERSHSFVPIGRPIDNTEIYILDRYLNPTPVGVPGELYIGGVCLARGYLNQVELTAQKFIPNPFSTEGGARLYRTGDLARYLSDGNIQLLGRCDRQIKIRGFRIEPDEIEARLSQHPDVSECAIALWEERGDKRLVAYVSPHSEREITVTQLRHFLKERLSDYAIPSQFVILEALPLLPNGKLDRRSLPVPDKLRPLDVACVMPQTEIEKTLATVWQKVLNLEQIGIHDNFFEVGGHSLLLARIYSRLREIYPINLSMLDLFRYPTISSLAAFLSQTNEEKSSSLDEIQTEKIASGKARQRKRLEKIKS
jgi:amino acid adenylation domain-containing protein